MLLPNAGKEWYNDSEVIALLKVFLVEDECVVREGLRDCIDWERYGFEFCGDAPDGELALPQIRKLRPDILITDIKMPFMDGLALSKLVCAELPETRIVLETDCPYMAPEPHRGTRNDSRNIRYVAEKIAQIKGITAQEVIDITNENAKKLFF